MKTRNNYADEAKKLIVAIDIAIETYRRFRPFNLNNKQLITVIDHCSTCKNLVLNPGHKFKNLKSLRYLSSPILGPFQEGVGPAVDYFWERVAEANLGYKRENKMENILLRGKIVRRDEYDFVKDMIVIAEQENLISPHDVIKLGQMIYNYEFKQK